MTQTPTTTRPKLRWYQISLRGVLILVTVLAMGSAWLGWKINQAKRQEAAVAALRAMGCWVVYQHEFPPDDNTTGWQEQKPGPEWLRSILGDDFFFTVSEVNLISSAKRSHTKLKEIANHLKNLPDLEILTLWHMDVDGMDLEPLADLTQLRELEFSSNNYGNYPSDDNKRYLSLAPLQKLQRLERLKIDRSYIPDSELVNLKSLPLKELSLANTSITDAGLAHLANLPLTRLDLSVCYSVTSRGMVHLQNMTQLKFLDLSLTQVDGEGMKYLVELPLETLGFASFGKITIDSVFHLKRITTLKNLILNPNPERVGDDVVRAIQEALPQCQIRDVTF